MTETIKEDQFEIIHERSPLFQTHRVEGAFVNVTPGGESASIAFFNQRAPIPKRVVHPINPKGDGSDVEVFGASEDLVREFCVCTVLDKAGLELLQGLIAEALNQMKEEDEG